MSKPKHTPGPWLVDGRDLCIGGQIVVQGRDFGPDGASQEEKLANLRLAAAAPDLLSIANLALEASRIDINGLAGRVQLSALLGAISGCAKVALKKIEGEGA